MTRTLLVSAILASTASSQSTVWYGGDFDGRNGAPNEVNTLVSHAKVYDDFIVPTGGVVMTGAWSNNLTDDLIASTAEVEIRTGVSEGNGGTVVFSGTFTASVTDTGREVGGFIEKEVRVFGLNVALSPGVYFVSVAPVGNGSGRSFVSSTSGAFGIGEPLANGNSFINSPDLAFDFASTDYLGPGDWDFSIGVEDSVGMLVSPTSFSTVRGSVTGGNLQSLITSDDNRLTHRPGVIFTSGDYSVQVRVDGTAPGNSVSELRFSVESSGSVNNLSQRISLFNFLTSTYEVLDVRPISVSDTIAEVVVGANPARFIRSGDRAIRSLVSFRATGAVFTYPWNSRIDRIVWRLTQ